MKICMMTNTYLPHVGGVARSVDTFSAMYRRLGHEALVVAPTFEEDDGVPEETERHVVRLPAIQRFNGSDFSVRLPMAWLLDTRLDEFAADIVHSHHPYLLGDSALRYAAEKNAPVVFTHHTLYEQYTHYVPFNSSTLRRFVVELSTHYANLCDAVIAPSESIARLIKDRGVTVPVEVIPTGVDVHALSGGNRTKFRAANGLPEDAFVVGHLGRLAPEKNLEYLGRAVVQFLREEPDAHFLVVGEGPSAAPMRELFDSAGVGDRLRMTGKLTGDDVCDAYAAMDAFAFSSFSETQGMVLAEAMAASLPAVALDASGVREVVRDGTNGFLLGAKTEEAGFAAKLRELKADGELRKRLSAEARRTAEAFSMESCAERALKLYSAVLERTGRKRESTARETLGTLFKRIEVEWSLIHQKAGAMYDLMASERPAKED